MLILVFFLLLELTNEMPVGSESLDCFPGGLISGVTFPLCEIANFSTVDSAIEDGLNFRLTHAIIIIKYSMNSLFLYARKKGVSQNMKSVINAASPKLTCLFITSLLSASVLAAASHSYTSALTFSAPSSTLFPCLFCTTTNDVLKQSIS